MFKRKWGTIAAGMLAVFMLVLAACEPVGGVDLNKALQNSAGIESYEGKASVSVELMMDEELAALIGIDPTVAAMLKDLRIELEEVKQQSPDTMSAKGYIALLEERIPFSLSVAEGTEMVLQVEGIGRPVVIDLGTEGPEFFFPGFTDEKMSEISQALRQSFAEYITVNLPNPKQISVKPETVTINGENVSVNKVNAVLYGDEVLDWLKLFLQNLAKDEQGLRNFLSDLYDLVAPLLEASVAEAKKEFEEYGIEDDFLSFVEAYLKNKTLIVEFLYTTIMKSYELGLEDYDEFANELAQAQEESGFRVLNRDSYLDMTIYVDNMLRVRKSEAVLLLKPELPFPVGGFDGIRITASQEVWNVNGEVTADTLSGKRGISLDDENFSSEFHQAVDPDSAIADLFRTFGLNQESFLVWLDEEGQVFKEKGTSYANAYWLAEELNWTVDWFMETDEVVVYDWTSGQYLKMRLGDTNASLNDSQEVTLSAAPVERDAMLYLPIRAVAEAFGAQVEYDADLNAAIITVTYY